MNRTGSIGTGVLALALFTNGPATAQQTDRQAVTESYDSLSPETPSFSEADMVVVNSTQIGGGGVQWSPAELGLPAGSNVDAFSDGSDILPPIPPILCRFAVVEYTVDRMSTGLPGSIVEAQVLGDGAASDTFGARFDGGGGVSYYLASDALDVTRLSPLTPVQSNLDALSWLERKSWPVFFSVDPSTALTTGVSAADVLVSAGGGSYSLFRSATSMGLVSADNIDALAVDKSGKLVFSLSPASPSAVAGSLAAVAAAGLMQNSGGATSTYLTPAALTLPPTSNLNGVRITDPGAPHAWDGSQINPLDGYPHDTILIDNYGGNVPHLVEVGISQPFQFAVHPLNPVDTYMILWVPGRPCLCNEVPIAGVPGFLAFGNFGPGCSGSPLNFLFFGVGPVQFPAAVNIPVELTMQAVLGSTYVEHTSNAITLRVN